MAIRGDLREAGLPDVLQLLGLGQKTGCLSVARPGNFGSIYFERGRIAYATIVNRRDRLGDALIKSGAVDEADLRAAVAEQAVDPAVRLGDLLLRRGAVTPEALERHVRAQVEEAVLQLFTWTEGTFSFEPEVRADPRDYVVSIDPGSVLLEGARRADEWQLIATTVPGLDAVFAMTAPDVGPAEERALDAAGFEMSAEERRVVALVDGRRDVSRLVEESGLGDFDVARTLHALASAGLARRVGTAPPRETPSRTPRVEEHRNLGVAFYATGLHDEASREFRRVLELAPSDGHARFHLGLIALRGGRWTDAAAALGEAAALPGAPRPCSTTSPSPAPASASSTTRPRRSTRRSGAARPRTRGPRCSARSSSVSRDAPRRRGSRSTGRASGPARSRRRPRGTTSPPSPRSPRVTPRARSRGWRRGRRRTRGAPRCSPASPRRARGRGRTTRRCISPSARPPRTRRWRSR
jgi:hypothetical protein